MALETASPAAEIVFVRPGREALGWLQSTVAELKQDDPLRPVSIVVPNYVAGRFALRWLARSGGYLNVQAVRLQALAEAIVGAPSRPRLSPAIELGAVREAIYQVLTMPAGAQLQGLTHHLSLQQALVQLFRELRRRDLDGAQLTRADGARSIARAALAAYDVFRRLTAGFDDPTDLREQAAAIAARSTGPVVDGAIVLFLPGRLDATDVRLVAAVARSTPLLTALPAFTDPIGLADGDPRETAAALAVATGHALPSPAPAPTTIRLPNDVRIVRVPDPNEEVREVVRAIASDLETGKPLYRTAVLYRQADPYGPLLRDALDRAGVPWSALDGRPLTASRAGRALLSLLRLPERRFTRSAVLEWLECEAATSDVEPVPVRVWDRLSREANVVRGASQWDIRLREHAAGCARSAERYRRDERDLAAARAEREARSARAMAATIARLSLSLEPPATGNWRDFVGWAEALRQQFAAPAPDWSEAERRAADDVALTLAGLADGDRVAGAAPLTLGLFLATLEFALTERSTVAGRLGDGILIGPVQSVRGLQFNQVFVVGLVEGAFPPPPAADPFFPRESDDPLGRRQRQREADRQAFLTAIAAADGGRLMLTTPDCSDGRPAFPSRWLLEAVAALLGDGARVDSASFRKLAETAHPWLRIVRSAADGLDRATAAADLEDYRRQATFRWDRLGQPLASHPLAASGSPLGNALTLARAHASANLTAFDGNLASAAATSRLLRGLTDGSVSVSASSTQTWATCPFRFFARQVLRIEPTSRPEDAWTIDPLANGSLVHTILERFFVQLQATGRPGCDEPYTSADVSLLEEIAGDELARAERSGLTGHPLVWENTRATILADLRSFLVEDERWRLAERLRPASFEQAFGTGEPGGWPAVAIAVNGGVLRFRGFIDRIDVSPSGSRAYIFDYKTGSARSYAGMKKDPVDAGKRVQLAVYARAVRQALGEQVETGAAYWFVTSNGGFEQIATGDDPAAVDRRLDDVLGLVARGIRTGLFVAFPDDRGSGFKNCEHCDYDSLCSPARGDRYERKQGDPVCVPFVSLKDAKEGAK